MEENKNQKQLEKEAQTALIKPSTEVLVDKSKPVSSEDVFVYAETKGSQIVKYSFYTMFVGTFVWIGFNLFFQQPASFFLGFLKMFRGPVQETAKMTELRIM